MSLEASTLLGTEGIATNGAKTLRTRALLALPTSNKKLEATIIYYIYVYLYYLSNSLNVFECLPVIPSSCRYAHPGAPRRDTGHRVQKGATVCFVVT